MRHHRNRLAEQGDLRTFRRGLMLLAVWGVLTGGLGGFLGAETVRLPYDTARNYAMGGVHAALADDFSVLYNNPAGYLVAEPELHFAELTLHSRGPIFSITDAVLAGELDKFFSEGLARNVGLGIQGPLAFGFVGNGLGFGIHNYSDVKMSVPGVSQPATADIYENFLLSGGYTGRIPLPEDLPMTLDAGFLLKGFVETGVTVEKDAVEIMGLLTSFDMGAMLNQPYYIQTGIGADMGLLYGYQETWYAGLSLRDVLSPTVKNVYASFSDFQGGSKPEDVVEGKVPFDMSLGVMWNPEIPVSQSYINELRVMLDYRDIWDFWVVPREAKNPILHVGLGAEAVLLDILSVRAGFSEGLFNAGFGMDLHFFELHTSMFGTEMGTEPGMNPVYNLMISLEFSR